MCYYFKCGVKKRLQSFWLKKRLKNNASSKLEKKGTVNLLKQNISPQIF